MSEAALERLEAEFRDVRIVVALGGLDELRPNKAAEINGWHLNWGLAGCPASPCPALHARQARMGVKVPT